MSTCVCGSCLTKTTFFDCYGHGGYCDGCGEDMSSYSVAYHCPRGYTYQHTSGYDLCSSCYQSEDSEEAHIMPTCKCGSALTLTTPSQCYGNGARCDVCRCSISSYSDVYHCPQGSTYQHQNGYDLCPSCYRGNDDSYMGVLIGQITMQNPYDIDKKYKKLIKKEKKKYMKTKQLSQEEAESIRANNRKLESQIERCEEEIEECMERVRDATQDLQAIEVTNKAIQSANLETHQHQKEIRVMEKISASLIEENGKLANQVNQLLDEKKEQERSMNDLQRELEYFQSKSMDEASYLTWDNKQLLLWIRGIDGGYFDKYVDALAIQLEECELSGKDLQYLTTTDIRGLGIKKFSDAKKIRKLCQGISQQKSNEK
eukprot:720237_1